MYIWVECTRVPILFKILMEEKKMINVMTFVRRSFSHRNFLAYLLYQDMTHFIYNTLNFLFLLLVLNITLLTLFYIYFAQTFR